MKKNVLLTSLLLILTGCATSYQQTGFTGGFEDVDLGGGRYKISFLGNGYTKTDTVKEYTYRRARELCKGDYDKLEEEVQPRGILAFPQATIVVQCKEI